MDGPVHFFANQRRVRDGATRLRDRLLRSAGWTVVVVPFYDWNNVAVPKAVEADASALAEPLWRGAPPVQGAEVEDSSAADGTTATSVQALRAAYILRLLRDAGFTGGLAVSSETAATIAAAARQGDGGGRAEAYATTRGATNSTAPLTSPQ